VKDVTISISVPKGWKSVVAGSNETTKKFIDQVMPGASVTTSFTVTSPATTGAGFLAGRVEWKDQGTVLIQSETSSQRVRNVFPVKINEVRFETGDNPTNQFIELYNAGDRDVDLSDWTLISTQSMWAPLRLAKIPAGTKIKVHGFYLLGLSTSGLVAPANQGGKIINVQSITGFEAGQKIDIDGETRTIATVGTAAYPMATVFVPVSIGPWLKIPAGSTNLPVTNTAGFEIGHKIGIDLGSNYEVATVTAIGKAATLTTLAVAAKAGENIIKVAANSNITVGDMLTIGTGARKEIVKVKRIINVVEAPSRGGFDAGGFGNGNTGDVELTEPLRFDHMLAVDVSDVGTGISFSPTTLFEHKSGDAAQALGSGITLESALQKSHTAGAAVLNPLAMSVGYQGSARPNQWYGAPLSSIAGSIALMDASGMVVVDAMVYGSRQSNSSANGTITSPEIATLEGDQSRGGCIVVVPGSVSGFGQFVPSAGKTDRSAGRFPDGADSDNNCLDFMLQNTITLAAPATAGSVNIKVSSVADFTIGQKIIIDTDTKSETAVINTIGTPGATTVGSATNAGAKVIPVTGMEGFGTGQTITIDNGANQETAVIASVAAGRRRFGSRTVTPTDTITLTMPLKYEHTSGAQISGSGITLTRPLIMAHDSGVQVAGNIPTPGAPNQYYRRPD
jgi:hypothetical protein